MDRNATSPVPNQSGRHERQLAHLKILSRLLGHELHAQTSPRITLSRDEVEEIQASLDMYIEEVLRQRGYSGSKGLPSELEVQAVPARMN
jgi:hypothetical protein